MEQYTIETGIEKLRKLSETLAIPSREVAQRDDAFNVMVVEDDTGHSRLICEAARECVINRPIDIVVCETGEIALELLDNYRPGVIILDLHLPVIQGLDILKRVRSIPIFHLTPIVILSGVGCDMDIDKCMAAGANAFVEKSSDVKLFRNIISGIIDFWGGICVSRHTYR